MFHSNPARLATNLAYLEALMGKNGAFIVLKRERSVLFIAPETAISVLNQLCKAFGAKRAARMVLSMPRLLRSSDVLKFADKVKYVAGIVGRTEDFVLKLFSTYPRVLGMSRG